MSMAGDGPLNQARVGGIVPAQRLDGRALAKRLEADIRLEVDAIRSTYGKVPCLAVILVGDDPASQVYVGHKKKACARVGIESREHRLPDTASEDELVGLIEKLNRDADVNGILVQLPLPHRIHKGRVLRSIVPYKDVDAFHPESVGHALIGDDGMLPCTPSGIVAMLDDAGIALRGAEVVIINHSNIVGKPLAAMLINRDATVTVCHEHTVDIAAHTKTADIVVTGTSGHRRLTADDIKDGAVVVDVSIIRAEDGSLHGDHTEDVWEKAAWVSPVPGGVGPMTVASLLQNTLRSLKRKLGIVASPPGAT